MIMAIVVARINASYLCDKKGPPVACAGGFLFSDGNHRSVGK